MLSLSAAAMIVAVPTAIALACVAEIGLVVVGRSPPAPAVDVPLRRLTRTVIGTHKTQFFRG